MDSIPTIQGRVPLAQPSPPAQAPQPGLPASSAADPFSKTVDLPSGGIYYPNGQKTAVIRPTRGEQEEMIAGTPEESPDRVRAIRHTLEQCVDLGGLPFSELLILDMGFLAMHLFALSAGTDEVNLPAGCDKQDCPLRNKRMSLTMLPCVHLRRSEVVEEATDAVEETDPDLLAAAAVERALAATDVEEVVGPTFREVPMGHREPFETVLPGGQKVSWRHHRVKDLEAAEEFAKATGATAVSGAKLATFLHARQIVALDGQQVGTVAALAWWKKTPTPVLDVLRADIRAKEFGYDMRPQVRCPKSDCRKEVRVRLPSDGSLFRRRA